MPAWLRSLARAVYVALHVVLLPLTFVVALLLGVVLHMNAAPLRRDVMTRVNAVLADTFVGHVTITSIGHLGLRGVDGVSARVTDAAGHPVLSVSGVSARVRVLAVVKSALAGWGPLAIDVTDAHVGSVDASLDADASGSPAIAGVFALKAPATPAPAKKSRSVRFAIDHLALDHAWIHGQPQPGGVPIDADLDAVIASLLVASPDLKADVTSAKITTRGMPSGANASGAIEAHVVLPAANGGLMDASATWKGAVAGIDETLTAKLGSDALDVVLDVPTVSPDAIRGLWPASTIAETGAAHVEAHGSLTHANVAARVALGKATIDVTGPVVWAGTQRADLLLDARAIDVNAVVLTAPPSNVAATGTLSLARATSGALNGKAEIDFDGGTLAGQRVPAGTVRATVGYDEKRRLHGDATITAHEPGAPTVLVVHVATSKNGALELTFDGDSNAPDLQAIPRLGNTLVQGSSVLKTHGTLDVERNVLDASAQVELEDVGTAGVAHVQHLSVTAAATGTVKAPQLDVTIHGDLLDIAGYRFSKVHIEAHGPPTHAHILISLRGEGAPDVDAELDLDIAATPTVTNFEATAVRGQDRLRLTADRVRVGRGEIDVDGALVEGLGAPLQGSARLTQTTLAVKADAKDLDLASLARVAGFEDALEGCRLALAVDGSLRRDAADGTASFDLSSCSLGKVKGATAHLDATMHARSISGRAHVEVPGTGAIDFTTSRVLIGGTAPVVTAWRRAWGQVKFDGHADLAKVAALLPAGALPLGDVSGTASVAGRVERDGMDDMTPGVILSVQTHGLTAVAPTTRTTDVDGSTTFAAPAWRVEGLDVGLDLHIDGDSGFADLSLRLVDPKGELATLDVKSDALPFSNLLATPAQAPQLLEAIQMSARLAVPERDVTTLPSVIAIPGAKGQVQMTLAATGSALKPMVDLDAKLSQVRARSEGLATATDFALSAHYDGAHLDATLSGDMKKSRVLDATASVDVVAADLIHGNTSAWTAGGKAHLAGLPLEALAALSDHQVKGKVSGDVTLDGLRSDAKAKVALSIDTLKVGDVTYKSGSVNVSLDGSKLDTAARLDQDDGFIDAHIQAASRWGKALAPTLDPAHALDCSVTSKRFRAALLLPFVDTVFTELDARMDSNLTATLDPQTQTAHLSGTVSVDSGRFELASIGGEFHDASMKLTFTPDGVVKVENVKASGMSGRIEAAATARLQNLALSAVNATVLIPDAAPLLLTVEGSQVGTFVGRMDVAANASPKEMDVTVTIPKLHVELPLTSTRDIQTLGDMDGVRIGTEAPKGFVPERLDSPKEQLHSPPGKTMKVTIDLGSDIQVKKGATLKVALGGKPTITMDDSIHASGQIKLLNGTIDVQGKAFDIENGTVSFVGADPTNPQVIVTATWDAPDGTRVYADFVGPLKTGKVTLRSEPSLPNNEILALILFGTPDGLTPASQGGGANQAGTAGAGVAGSAAAQPLNQALQSYGLGGVTTRVDTSTANPRPEVEVQIAREVSLQVAYVIGTPPPGTNPDSTLFTLNWRFIRQWSLETTIGSAGTSILDLIWQYRY